MMDTYQPAPSIQAGDRQRESDAKVSAYRQLTDAALRFHQAQDAERLLPLTVEGLRTVFGPTVGVVVSRIDGQERHYPFGGKAIEAIPSNHLQLLVQKSMSSLNAILDGQGPTRVLAVPLLAGPRVHGCLVVLVGDAERRLGTAAIDLVGLMGRHLGIALDNAVHTQELKSLSTADNADLQGGFSLCESKRQFERKLIKSRLREAHGNIALAARTLDMDRGQLSRLLKKYAVDKKQYKSHSA
jgi:DNA-binding protein Fis